MVAALPKFKSAEFRAVLAEVKSIFDAHSLGVLMVDALERPVAEQVFARFARQAQGTRSGSIKKTELVGHLTSGFFTNDEVAYHLIKELDRACAKERHIVASIPAEQAPERIGSYRAIALKRERAKLVWGLARDERETVRALANRVISEFFQETAVQEGARAVLEGEVDGPPVEAVAMAKSLKEQANQLEETAKKLNDLESQVSRYEEDRARLLAQIGARERALKQESEAREEVESQLTSLKRALETVESEQRAIEAAKQSEHQARAVADDLAQKVRRLEKLASASKTLAAKEDELHTAQKRTEELGRALDKERESREQAERSYAEELAKVRAELEVTRDELHRARKQLAEGDRPEIAPGSGAGLLILLDQANLAAAASINFRRKVNFSGLYETLRAGRKVSRAVAFVVDNGGAFDAFADTLKRSGWDLRIKKPRVFQNGEVKADWDMGIAIEAIERAEHADTIVLVSGDGDFVPLVKHLKRLGKRVEVAAFSEGLAMDLANAADGVLRLGPENLE